MRGILLCISIVALSSAANAEVWIATCAGKDLEYVQAVGGRGDLHLGQGNGTYQTITFTQTFHDAETVCGAVDTGQKPVIPVVQICASKSQQAIYLLLHRHKGPPAPDEAPYCHAVVTVIPGSNSSQ